MTTAPLSFAAPAGRRPLPGADDRTTSPFGTALLDTAPLGAADGPGLRARGGR
ncbi:hypothetical protein [Oerskovia paurometabola]|uniref:hypothetical protein n=1 Tax=Oerskovia paurometabola TaxID=162170 RepID=UPI00195F14D4|nr:hypothetical protein [Oerskovia paurometabola]MBM7496010.1 hypothetical protein [Oerskovia paurometabola]